MKLWGGRFDKRMEGAVESFTSSISFDRRLYREDIEGSIAHARMLAHCGVISAEEAEAITRGLESLLADIESGHLEFSQEHEDIHMNLEKLLTDRIGPVGGKLHTARSRNDQVATDMHLYMKRQLRQVMEQVGELQGALVALAEDNCEAAMPGYTHLQRAQPVTLAHHLLAYFEMFERDYGRFSDCLKRTDCSPLGSAALAGTAFPIDRRYTALELGFSRIYRNSMDAVSDRDYLLEFLSAASVCMMHLSRLAEELILWSTQEFGFVELDDSIAAGSSIMPQKKNPDPLELIRGKTGRVYGHLMALLTVMKALPLAYHTDMQEDKESTFDALDTLKSCLAVMTLVLNGVKFNRARMRDALLEDFSNATDVADYLSRKGLPFREAHRVVGGLVRYCLGKGKTLSQLSLEEFQQASPLFERDVMDILSPEACVAARSSEGGTAPSRVRQAVQEARKLLEGRKTT